MNKHGYNMNADPSAPAEVAKAPEKAVNAEGAKIMLFATKTCPNCKMAAKFLDDAGVVYDKLFAEENADLATKLEIKQAPTLVIVTGDSVEKIVNVSNIRKFAEEA